MLDANVIAVAPAGTKKLGMATWLIEELISSIDGSIVIGNTSPFVPGE